MRICNIHCCVSLGRARWPSTAVATCGPGGLVRKSNPTGHRSPQQPTTNTEESGGGGRGWGSLAPLPLTVSRSGALGRGHSSHSPLCWWIARPHQDCPGGAAWRGGPYSGADRGLAVTSSQPHTTNTQRRPTHFLRRREVTATLPTYEYKCHIPAVLPRSL